MHPDHVAVILHPAITEASWSEVEAFGTDVRKELEGRHSPACLVDLSPLTYMGSSLVALIVRVWKVVQARGGRMVIVCAHPIVLDVIKLAGLDKVWTIAPDVEAGQKKLGIRARAQAQFSAADIPPTQPVTVPVLMHADGEPSARPRSNFAAFAIGVVTVLIALLVAWLMVMQRR